MHREGHGRGDDGDDGDRETAGGASQERRPEEPADRAATERQRVEQEHLKALRRARQGLVAKAIVALVLLVILIVFIISNATSVKVDYVFATGHPKLIWVMLFCAVVGAVVGYLIGRPSRHARLRRRGPGGDERGGSA